MSVESAVVTLKRYLPEERHRIRFHDLIGNETERVISAVTDDSAFADMQFSPDELLRRVRAYEASGEILRAMYAVGMYWCREEHVRTWQTSVERLAAASGGGDLWASLRRYAGMLALYAGGVSALAADNWIAMRALLLAPQIRDTDRRFAPAFTKLHKWAVMDRDVGLYLPGMRGENTTRKTPVSDWIVEVIRPAVRALVPDATRYEELFDDFEYFLALHHSHLHSHEWGPIGRFQWRWKYGNSNARAVWAKNVESEGADWAPLQAGFFNSDPERFKTVKTELDAMVARAR